MGAELITSLYQYGVAPTAAILCTSLYIRQVISEKAQKKEDELNDKTIANRDAKYIELFTKILDGQATILEQIRTLTSNTVTLAELSRNLSNDNHSLMLLTNTLITDVKVLANNQLTIMNGFQKVIEQLIETLRD
jgi:hypothetical protein